MVEMLRQSTEKVMASKGEMDLQLRSYVWDNPTGCYFTEKYEEDLSLWKRFMDYETIGELFRQMA